MLVNHVNGDAHRASDSGQRLHLSGDLSVSTFGLDSSCCSFGDGTAVLFLIMSCNRLVRVVVADDFTCGA